MNKILIYGPRKSGSTLLQSLIDGHSDIISFPGEFKIKLFYKLFQLEGSWQKKYLENSHSIYSNFYKKGQDHKIMKQFFSFDNFYRELEDQSLKCNELSSLVDLEAKLFCSYLKREPKYMVYKEVGGNTEFIVFTFKMLFPDSKIVLLKRSAKAIVSSIIRDRKKKGVKMSLKAILGEIWEALKINRYIDLIKELNLGCYVINYEAIIENPENELNKISDYLSIDFEPIMLRPTTLGKNVVVKTSSKKTERVEKTTKNWKSGLAIREKILIRTVLFVFKLLSPNLVKN